MKSKTGVMLVAAILIGAAVLSFVAYTAFDVVGFGKTVSEQIACSSPVANQTFTLKYPAESTPTITYWTGAGGSTYGGAVSANATQTITWDSGNQVAVNSYGVTWNGYPGTATFLMFNYTGQGSTARGIVQPVIILVAVFAIVAVAVIMIRGSTHLGGHKGKGGHKSFP